MRTPARLTAGIGVLVVIGMAPESPGGGADDEADEGGYKGPPTEAIGKCLDRDWPGSADALGSSRRYRQQARQEGKRTFCTHLSGERTCRGRASASRKAVPYKAVLAG